MIRLITPADLDALLAIAVSSGLVPPDGTETLRDVLNEHFAGKLGPDHTWITDDANRPVAVAYYAPERLTDGTWNLYMIAVHPDCQGQGRGAALIKFIEDQLKNRGARLLIVDTSGLPEFESTRIFYRKCGFEQEAIVREFWKAGDDKIVFRKLLTETTSSS